MPSWILWLGIGAVVLSYFAAPLAAGERMQNIVLGVMFLLFVGGIATAGITSATES